MFYQTEGRVAFEEIPAEKSKDLFTNQTIVLTSANYEERSRKLFDIVPAKSGAHFMVLNLKAENPFENISTLDSLQDENKEYGMRVLTEKGVHTEELRVAYPIGFDMTAFSHEIVKRFVQGGYQRIVLDISALPRRVILALLQSVDEIWNQGKLDGMGDPKFHVVYTSAAEYPSLSPPQEVGVLKGLFEKKQLSEMVSGSSSKVRAIAISSIGGNEVRVLLEQIRAMKVEDFRLIIPLFKDGLLTSLKVMWRDPALLNEIYVGGYRHSFAFSLIDAARQLDFGVKRWMSAPDDLKDSTCFIAPFNVKLLMVPAYYAYTNLLGKAKSVDILWLSAYNYNSLYSLGVGRTSIWKIGKKLAD